MSLIQQLNTEQRQTFVIVTHDADIGALCNRIVRMNDGEIIDQGQREAPEEAT
jgi:putative ABC transport system ATP-binding protein